MVAGDRVQQAQLGVAIGLCRTPRADATRDAPRRGHDDDVARIDALAEVSVIVELLQDLPTDQRTAVLARIVDEGEYADIAVTQGVSEAVVRQRVSRGLAGLRRQWEKRV